MNNMQRALVEEALFTLSVIAAVVSYQAEWFLLTVFFALKAVFDLIDAILHWRLHRKEKEPTP